MKNPRKYYDQEFKRMAVELVESGRTPREVGDDLGVIPNLICRWRREFNSNSSGCFPGNGNVNLTPEQKEIAQLKRELLEAQLESDILKKAVSIFSKSDGRSMSS